jgi:hypothetical protein
LTLPESRFGVVLVDHAPIIQRVIDIIRLKDLVDFIVIHDTNAAEGTAFNAVWPHFRYRFDDMRYIPWTSVVSNAKELKVDWR